MRVLERFTIATPQSVLDDLHERLRRTRLPEEPAGAGWEYGTNLAYMRRLLRYWQSEYDWRQVEARLNRLPQHRASLGGYRIHLVYERGSGPRPCRSSSRMGGPGHSSSSLRAATVKVHRRPMHRPSSSPRCAYFAKTRGGMPTISAA